MAETGIASSDVTAAPGLTFRFYVGPRVEGEPESARARAVVTADADRFVLPAGELDRMAMEWLHARGKFNLDAFQDAISVDEPEPGTPEHQARLHAVRQHIMTTLHGDLLGSYRQGATDTIGSLLAGVTAMSADIRMSRGELLELLRSMRAEILERTTHGNAGGHAS